MPGELIFAAAAPAEAAARLDAASIHLWRIPYALSQGRAPLRALLAAYADVPEPALALEEDARGKPRLAGSSGGGARRLEFNWSHSADYALLALSLDCALGVDIERLGKNLRPLEIARRFFDPAEADFLERLDARARDNAFIELWCAKEAVLKAAGEGLSFGLARLVFERGASNTWSLARTDPRLGDAAAWHLEGFDPVSGYRGALAWQGGARNIVALQPAA